METNYANWRPWFQSFLLRVRVSFLLILDLTCLICIHIAPVNVSGLLRPSEAVDFDRHQTCHGSEATCLESSTWHHEELRATLAVVHLFNEVNAAAVLNGGWFSRAACRWRGIT